MAVGGGERELTPASREPTTGEEPRNTNKPTTGKNFQGPPGRGGQKELRCTEDLGEGA